MHSHHPETKLNPFNLAGVASSLPINFIGSRTGATGTLDDLKTSPPVPKAWITPSLVNAVISRLKAHQHLHSRLDQHAIIHENLFDPTRNRYRIVWSKNMITSAGVSEVHRKGAEPELALHLRDGEEERRDSQCYPRLASPQLPAPSAYHSAEGPPAAHMTKMAQYTAQQQRMVSGW